MALWDSSFDIGGWELEEKEEIEENGEIIAGKMSLRYGMEDIDFMESGKAKETLRDSHLCPFPNSNRNVMCYLIREGKDSFWLYREADNHFMLSAKRVNDDFYISQYHEFPYHFGPTFTGEEIQLGGSGAMGASFCGTLRLAKNKQYVLYNRACECCDGVHGIQTCGPNTQLDSDRQILGTVRHFASSVRTGSTAVDCNAVRVNLPVVHDDFSRDVWCPRTSRLRARSNSGTQSSACFVRQNSTSSMCSESSLVPQVVGRSKPRPNAVAAASKYMKGSKKSRDTEAGVHVANLGEVEAVVVNTKRPRFDRVSGSLRMKFFDNRVVVASSKNLIFEAEGSNTDRGILQFGKASKNRFNLDFKYPLAPVQAFAIGLSLFNWQGPTQD